MAKQNPTTPTHRCTQAASIKRTHDELFGNGKKGVRDVVNSLSQQMESIAKSIETTQADVKVLLQFQTQVETKEVERGKHKDEMATLKEVLNSKQRWLVGLIVTTVLTLGGLIVAIATLITKLS